MGQKKKKNENKNKDDNAVPLDGDFRSLDNIGHCYNFTLRFQLLWRRISKDDEWKSRLWILHLTGVEAQLDVTRSNKQKETI